MNPQNPLDGGKAFNETPLPDFQDISEQDKIAVEENFQQMVESVRRDLGE
jgi:hypothetical protein